MKSNAETALAIEKPHALTGDEVLEKLDSTSEGLSGDEAVRRLESVGPNHSRRGELKRISEVIQKDEGVCMSPNRRVSPYGGIPVTW
jgi:hypothetical protein